MSQLEDGIVTIFSRYEKCCGIAREYFYSTYFGDHFWYKITCLFVKKITQKKGNDCTKKCAYFRVKQVYFKLANQFPL
jgi:hypothetical protein